MSRGTQPVMPTMPVSQGPMSANTQAANNDSQVINYLINGHLQLAHYMKEYGIKFSAPAVAYHGFSAYFMVSGAKLERKAYKLMFLVQKLGGSFILQPINAQNANVDNPAAALESIITYEENMLSNLRNSTIQSPIIQHFMEDLIAAKALHLGMRRTFLTKVNRVRNDPAGLGRIDDELLLMIKYKMHHEKYHLKHHHHEHKNKEW